MGSLAVYGEEDVTGDILWTTLWIEGGAGPLTSRLMAWTWRALRWDGTGATWLLVSIVPYW